MAAITLQYDSLHRTSYYSAYQISSDGKKPINNRFNRHTLTENSTLTLHVSLYD